MFQLVYVSTAAWAMNENDLNIILDGARANNRKLGVTGLLLHIDQGFLQVLEGPREAVLKIFERIRRDLRHIGLRVLIQQEVEERLFEDWSMGFDRLSPTSPRTQGVFAVTQEAIENVLPPEKAKVLAVILRNFYRVHAGNNAVLERL
jgi:Sensors of blue-light using FAD.